MLRAFATALAFVIAGCAHAAERIPPETWALRDVISSVQVSPDGKSMALMRIPGREGDPVIEVFRTNDLAAEPFRVNADPMEITDFRWVADDALIFGARQKVRDIIDDFNQGVYETRYVLVDIKRKRLRQFDETDPELVSILPRKKDKILISFSEGDSGETRSVDGAFRPRAYWELDLERGTKKLLIRGKLSLGNIDFDIDGNPVLARGYDIANEAFVWYWRPEGTTDWKEFHRQDANAFDTFTVYGPDPDKKGNFIVEANNGKDTTGLWSYSAVQRRFDELLYQRKDVDICGVARHSNEWEFGDRITGVTHCTDKPRTEFFDDREAAVHAQLAKLIPGSDYLTVRSSSRDGSSLVVYNVGARDPGTYYLLHGGKLSMIGSRNPFLKPELLSELRYLKYPSRDGKKIPGYITVPRGTPPFPLVVLPHGGPFVSEVPLFDEWAQLLAHNGYLVLQPQYRGSRGYGNAFYQSAFMSGGQGGKKMQDDKDDGVDYLVAQGLARKDKAAMFGWSYGGYAALVAASRADQRYRCVIAGAAVSDPLMQVNYYRYRLRGAQKIEQLQMWDDSVSPMDEADKVNVPILLVHGDVDQRVPVDHARKYKALLERHGKPFRYVELKGADHFSDTLFYGHKLSLYTELLGYLAGPCGMASGATS